MSESPRPRLAIAASHPIQYYAPLFRELATRLDVEVFFAHQPSPQQQAAAGFGTAFEWDVDLTYGYRHSFLANVSKRPGVDHFSGCDTPEIGHRLREGGFEALLVFGWHLKSAIQATVAAKRLNIPVMVRGDSQLQTPRSMLKRLGKSLAYPPLLRAFDAALYVGSLSRAYYGHYHFPNRRLFFSPHCVDTEWFADRATQQAGEALRAAANIPLDAKVVLFAGKLMPLKRPEDIVEACARVRAAGLNVHMAVAGSGELEQSLRDKAAALGTPVHFLGFCNQTRMPAVYAAANVLMLPSAHETWGLVCNEALACGTPIVVSDQVGCAPDLADGDVGRVFRLGDSNTAATMLMQFLESPPDRRAFVAKSASYGLAAATNGIVEATEAVRRRRQG